VSMRRTLLLLGMMMLALLLAGGMALAATSTFENTSTITINDAGPVSASVASPYPSQIEVSGLSTTPGIEDVNLTLKNYSHSFPDDVGVLVVSPQGQTALVMSDVGSNFDVSGIDLTLDDEATGSLRDAGQITAGTYKPTQGTNLGLDGLPSDGKTADSFPSPAPAGPYGTQLSVFDGTDPNGTWSLYVLDDTISDAGSITGWSLDFSTPSVPTTKQQCKNGGWREFGYPDQGTCISDVNRRNR
jgi:subtilisin-like proprotein convertase family protein